MGGICRVGWKLIAAAVGAVMSAGMWGCSDQVDYYLSERDHGGVVGFIDDSLVMVLDHREWAEDRTTWNGVYSEKSGYQDGRLCIYNYRVQEDGPRACDSISGDFSYSGQLTDSIIWYGMFGSRNSLHLWKFGGDVRYYSFNNALEVVTEGCSASFDAAKAHQWFDGKFIVIGKQSLTAGNDSCQYAVLDTVGRTLVYKRLDENLKWIEKCDDVRAWGEDVYCLAIQEKPIAVLLLTNGIVVDQVEHPEWHEEYLSYRTLKFDGNMLQIQSEIYGINLDEKKIENDPGVFFSSEMKFTNQFGGVVKY